MTTIHHQAELPYSAEQMYALVDDVARYPEFLPWCQASRILEDSPTCMVARLTIAKAGWQQAFTTRNHKTFGARIEMQLVDGPFKELQGIWQFERLAQGGCRVDFWLSFEFASKLLQWTVGSVFSQIAHSLVDAFKQRADEIYKRDSV